jgi:hypothetical protein
MIYLFLQKIGHIWLCGKRPSRHFVQKTYVHNVHRSLNVWRLLFNYDYCFNKHAYCHDEQLISVHSRKIKSTFNFKDFLA